jgi:hypothetical protein
MGEVGEVASDELVAAVADEMALGFVGVDDASFPIELDDADGGVVLGCAQAPLARPQRRLALAQAARRRRDRARHLVDLRKPCRQVVDGLAPPSFLAAARSARIGRAMRPPK